jgi:hypothetical protein
MGARCSSSDGHLPTREHTWKRRVFSGGDFFCHARAAASAQGIGEACPLHDMIGSEVHDTGEGDKEGPPTATALAWCTIVCMPWHKVVLGVPCGAMGAWNGLQW